MASSLRLLSEDSIKKIKILYDDLTETEKLINFQHFAESLSMSEKEDDVTLAMELINERLENNPRLDPLEKADLYYLLAVTYLRKGRIEECNSNLERVFEVSPKCLKAKMLARTLESQSDSNAVGYSQILLAASTGGVAGALLFTKLIKLPGWLRKLAMNNPIMRTASDVSDTLQGALKDSPIYGVGVAALLAVVIFIELKQHSAKE